VVTPLAGSKFDFANKGSETGNGDCLSIVAPSPELVTAANESEDPNDGSYVIVYRSSGGNIVFGGDAHDETWDYVIANHRALVENCSILIAPHHGRDSDRQYDFLDVLKPRLTLFGTADSEHLGYGAYHQRELKIITNNQAGNVVLVPKKNYIEVFLENRRFAETYPSSDLTKTECGAYFARNVLRHQPPV
jgi:competence protein ComEC